MNKFFTSDLHFGHENVIKYSNRPFFSKEEMDEILIQNWNSIIREKDEVFILGDLFFCKEEESIRIIKRLKGVKYLIYGNHDVIIRKKESIQKYFSKILPELHHQNIDGIHTVMSHYPLLTWNKSHYGSFMLHGHCHGNILFDEKIRRLDVGVDTNNYFPYNWEDIKKKLNNVPLPILEKN